MKKTKMSILDDIAKHMSKKQINALYESKFNKKYKNRLLNEGIDEYDENKEAETDIEPITIYAEDLDEHGISVEEFEYTFLMKYDYEYTDGYKNNDSENIDTIEVSFTSAADKENFKQVLKDAGFSDKEINIIYEYEDADSYYNNEEDDDKFDEN